MAENTPMKRQYNEIKSRYKDCLLFFRLGDFYEMFDEDAKIASRELELALTTRDKNVEDPEARTPMCGVPYHSCEAYIARLIARGYKVAICEQTEDPAQAKGLVSRDVVRVITPGTVTESSMLEEGRSNYVCALYKQGDAGAAAFCDVSTGEFCAAYFHKDAFLHLRDELARFLPREAVLCKEALEDGELAFFLKDRINCLIEDGSGRFEPDDALFLAKKRFSQDVPDRLLAESEPALRAIGGLLSYLEDTQKLELGHINCLELFSSGRYMELDYSTRRNMELTENLRTGEKKGSLLWVLDKTGTPMGGRLLRSWTERPLLSPVDINRRQAAVAELHDDHMLRGELREILRGVGDIQRLAGRAVYGTANGRDMLSLGRYCAALPKLSKIMSGCRSSRLRAIAQTPPVTELSELIERAICDDPPFSVREGGILRPGYDPQVDHLREIRKNGSKMLIEMETTQRERTGIKKLKIGYNKVFGYYIDVPRSAGVSVPEDYIRKQTLVSNERYFTQELKDLENTLITARDSLGELEYGLFDQVRRAAAEQVAEVQAVAEAIAELDALCSLAEVAVKNGYVCPVVDRSGVIQITAGRHPVVEQAQKDVLFVPNDVYLDRDDDRTAIITGPNMAGKSTYMRQTALILHMAQMGSFVPAKSARIGVADRIFTRIGASDDLASGRSTFMVEMTEVSDILRRATGDSLLILDEIGRGTSTYDGMAIARAVLEYCADKKKLGARTMFATHYHELSVLEGALDGVRNYNITARKQGGEIIFLRRIVRGAADDSYGVEVAKLAGVPDSVVERARQCLRELEETGVIREKPPEKPLEGQMSLMDISGAQAAERLRQTDLNVITPIEAMNLLFELKRMVEK